MSHCISPASQTGNNGNMQSPPPSNSTFTFTTNAEHGTVYNGSFTGNQFTSGSSGSRQSSLDGLAEDLRVPGAPQSQHVDNATTIASRPHRQTSAHIPGHDANAVSRMQRTHSLAGIPSEGGYPTEQTNASEQYQYPCHAEPAAAYPASLTAYQTVLAAPHLVHGPGAPHGHHGRPPSHRAETYPPPFAGTHLPPSHVHNFGVPSGREPLETRNQHYQGNSGLPGFPQATEPHPRHSAPHVQPAQPQPISVHRTVTMPFPQHNQHVDMPQSPPFPVAFPQHVGVYYSQEPTSEQSSPTYSYFPTPTMTPSGSEAGSEVSNWPQTPRTSGSMPTPEFGKAVGWAGQNGASIILEGMQYPTCYR